MSRLIEIYDILEFANPIGLAKPELDILVIDQLMFGAGPQNINVVQAAETETAQAITVQKRINVAQIIPPSGNPTNLLSNSFDWTDSNSDGIANSWQKAYSNESCSIVTGNGFTGNAQRVVANEGGTAQAIIPDGFTFNAAKTYTFKCKYRCNNRIILFNGVSQELGTILSNTGDAVSSGDITLSPSSSDNDFRLFLANNADWFEIDEIELFDNSEVLPSGNSDEAQTITPQLIAGADRIDVTQATETNTSQAVSKLKSKAISQVSENETAQVVGKTKNISVAQSTSSDSAQSVTVFRRKNISVEQATETDSADAVSRSKSKAITQTTETDSLENISKSKSKSVTQVLESNEALTISSELRIETVVEANIAQTITAQKVIPVVEATETNEAFTVGVVKQIAIAQVTENCSAEEIGRQKRKSICPSSSYELYCDAVTGAIKYHFFLEKKSDNPYHLIDGMDYLGGTALSYKIGESASPTFSITLPDDGIEYTSGVVVENNVGVYSGMQVQLFNTESIPVIEIDSANSISKIKYNAVEQTTETDFVDDIIPSQPGIILIFRADETETALAITAVKLITISSAEETEFAQGLAQILKQANISFAEETDLAVNISDKPTKYIEITLLSETDKAFVIRRFNPADVNDDTLQVNSSVPLSVNIIDGYDVTGVSSDFDISVNIYQDTIQVNYETPYLQEHN